MRARIATFGILLALLTVPVVAQVGSIAGTVTDESGAALPGVLVEVTSPSLIEKVRSTVTDEAGRYEITNLPIGTYTIAFTLEGFTQVRRERIVLTADFPAPVSVRMTVGNVLETVSVFAAAPTLDAQSARTMTTFTGEDLRALPTARNPSSLLNLVPGNAAHGRLMIDGVAAGDSVNAQRAPDTETYATVAENEFRRVADEPLSTFSIDVDTASYANVRRFLNDGALPPPNAVRVEEMINYFRFDYPQPKGGMPFSITTELAESPWNPLHRLALIGLQGRAIDAGSRAPRNLVFLLDVSGSMQSNDKLPLVRDAMRMLVGILEPADRVAIVVYAGASGLVLPSTTGAQKTEIHAAIQRLEAGGSTNGAAGIRLAYETARRHFIPGGVNRVVLATDGDFNVGTTSFEELVALIEEERKSGVFLSVLGVGTGNLRDATMEMLADKGNGNYSYLDSLQEAQKVLVREANSTLVTIAKDVKIQVEFNPATVRAYRLIGYENRILQNEDFDDDRKDAGEIGAGHTVTALYEIVPAGVTVPALPVIPLKYQPSAASARGWGAYPNELMTVSLRYKKPDGDKSRLVSSVVRNEPRAMTANLGFASAVAELGMLLRGSVYAGTASFESLAARARTFRGTDADGYRAEFIKLSELAASLRTLRDAPQQSRVR